MSYWISRDMCILWLDLCCFVLNFQLQNFHALNSFIQLSGIKSSHKSFTRVSIYHNRIIYTPLIVNYLCHLAI